MSALLGFFFNLFEPVFRLGQKLLGSSRIGWLFVGPNLLIISLFTFLPIVVNLVYAVTGGVNLLPTQRPFVGLDNFGILLECRDYSDLQSCRTDIFWRSIFNTVKFSLIQVALMLFFSLVTALVLNRKIIGRGFWRGVFFYPVLLSPVVVALIWKWLLQSQGVFNAGLVAMGATPMDWLLDRHWAFFWVVVVSIWAHMGFYTLILLAGLQAIPKDVYEAAEMDAAPPFRVLRRITLPLLMPNLIVVLVLVTPPSRSLRVALPPLQGATPAAWQSQFRGAPGIRQLAGLVVMFGPVLWLVMSSFKTESALSQFPPSFLPYSQKEVVVAGHEKPLPLFMVKDASGQTRLLAQVRRIGLMATMVDPAVPETEIRININERQPVNELKFASGNYTELFGKFAFGTYLWNSVFITVVATILTLLFNSMAAFALSKYQFTGQKTVFILIIATLMIPPTIILVPAFLVISELNLLNSLWGVILPRWPRPPACSCCVNTC
jgi:alpha-1,4-digalacturonate transport system permease protein